MQLKHIRKKATPSAAPASLAASGSRHQKLFLQQLEHAQQQQQQQQKSAASGQTQRLPQGSLQISSGASQQELAKKAKHKRAKPGAKQVKGQQQQTGLHPSSSIRDKHQLQQHRKLMSIEALRKREESRSAWVQAYREAKHRGSAKQSAAGATPSSLARMVAAGQ